MFSAECEEKGETPEGIVFYPVALGIWHFDESIPRSNIFQTILQIAVSNFWFLDFKLFFLSSFLIHRAAVKYFTAKFGRHF